MIQILTELDVFGTRDSDPEEIRRAAERVGGFAIGGWLMEEHHGAGIWICPQQNAGLQLMIPWHFVRSVVTAEEPKSSKIFGLITELDRNGTQNGIAKPNADGGKPQGVPPPGESNQI
jgi:hypothetical protein